MKKVAIITVIALIIGLMFIPITPVDARRGGRGRENRPEGRGRPPILSGEQGRKILEIILAIYKSLKSGQPVKLSL